MTLNPALSTHPSLVCLDLGDCMLGDEALGLICGMLPPDGAKSGNTFCPPTTGELGLSSVTLNLVRLSQTEAH